MRRTIRRIRRLPTEIRTTAETFIIMGIILFVAYVYARVFIDALTSAVAR